MQLKVFQVQEERNRPIIKERTRELIGEGSNLVRASLQLFAKAVDSLYDADCLTAGQIMPWQVAVSIEAARVYNHAEASLFLLERGYPIGCASCLRSAIEAARLLALVLVDEKAAKDYTSQPGSKRHKRFRGRGVASEIYNALKKHRQCSLSDDWVNRLYGDLSQIAHPSVSSAISVLRKSEDRTILGAAYHPLEFSRIIWGLLNTLLAVIQDVCFNRPLQAPSLPGQLHKQGETLLGDCKRYMEPFRDRWLSEIEKDPTLNYMIEDFDSAMERLRSQGSSSSAFSDSTSSNSCCASLAPSYHLTPPNLIVFDSPGVI